MSWTGTRWIGAQSRTTYGGYGIGSSRRACLSPVRRNGARRVLRGRRRSNAPPLPDYWAVDTLQAAGARVHLAHPLGVKGFRYRRLKNDVRDAADLADLLRMNRLPQGLDRATGHPRVAGVGALSGQNCGRAFRAEGPGARRAGQGGGVDPGKRPVRGRRTPTPG